jgi:DNA-binding LacI/PurR family transcriptional regulator
MELLELIKKNGISPEISKRANANGIYKVLREYVTSKKKIDPKLPAISELTKHFGANYRTVKSALTLLENEGLIVYEPNVGAAINQKTAIAYVRWEGNAFNGMIYDGVRNYCLEQKNLDLIIVDAHKNHQRVFDGIRAMAEMVDGIILMPFEVDGYHQLIEKLLTDGTRVVQIDRILPDLNVSSVTVDDFGGSFQAVRHLISEHKRPVYFLGNSGTPSSSHNRYVGWEEAMKEYGYFDTSKYCIDIEITESDSRATSSEALCAEVAAAEKLFKDHPDKVYSIFATNDIFASKVCHVAKNQGLVVGKDVFISGFGDMPFCENLDVQLTSVKQNPGKLGYHAAELIHAQFQDEKPFPVHKVISANLIIRQSSLGLKNTPKG